MSTKPLDLETQLIERIVKQRNERVVKAEERAKEILKSAQEEVESRSFPSSARSSGPPGTGYWGEQSWRGEEA